MCKSKIILLKLLYVIVVQLILIPTVFANEKSAKNKFINKGNPFIQHIFTADPSARVFEGKIYVYPSHDRDDAVGFDMTDYHVFSTNDLFEWKDHGVVLDVKDVPWAKEYMWAPDCIFKNGTYYLYFPARDKQGVFRIGVASSKFPYGPFVPEPEPIKGSFSVDPGLFIDDDGQAYMYFGGDGMGGQKKPVVAKMTEDMKQFKGDPIELDGFEYWFEACWMNKINNKYYLSYSTGETIPGVVDGSCIAYSVSDNPMGPFKYVGLIKSQVKGWTNHHSIVEWKGQMYFFYHTSDLSGGETNKRNVSVEYLHITDDGIIQEVAQTKIGVGHYKASEKIEAENFSESSGVVKSGNVKSGIHVRIKVDDYIKFDNIDFENQYCKNIKLRIKGVRKNGVIEIRENDKYAKLLAKTPIVNTKGDQEWKTIVIPCEAFTHSSSIVIKYKAKKGEFVDLDWISFE